MKVKAKIETSPWTLFYELTAGLSVWNVIGFSKEQVVAFNKGKGSVSEDFFDFSFK